MQPSLLEGSHIPVNLVHEVGLVQSCEFLQGHLQRRIVGGALNILPRFKTKCNPFSENENSSTFQTSATLVFAVMKLPVKLEIFSLIQSVFR